VPSGIGVASWTPCHQTYLELWSRRSASGCARRSFPSRLRRRAGSGEAVVEHARSWFSVHLEEARR
jgi:hypothetical protein